MGPKEQGYSNRAIASMINCNRKTVGRYWNKYLEQKQELENSAVDQKRFQEEMTCDPKCEVRKYEGKKFTVEIEKRQR